MRLRALLPLAVVFAAAAGPAPDRPQMTPTKDALVGYHLTPGAGEAIDVRVAYRNGGKALRVDLPDQSYMLVEPPTKSLVMVVPLEQTALTLPWADGPQPLFLLDERMKFTRKTELTVAGQRCMQWEAAIEATRSTLCVTAEGVVLRNQSQDGQGRRNLIEAFIVRYMSLPELDYVVPAGFEHLAAAPHGGD